MIVDLPSTTTQLVTARMVLLREEVGAMALTRVLTLVIPCEEAGVEDAISVAMDASRQHPCRIVVVATANRRGSTRLDAQIRIGGDAGASEVIILRLYGPLAEHGRSVVTPLLLADSPIVAWWPGAVPDNPSADPIGEMAQRRITDAAFECRRPTAVLERLATAYQPGDTDLAWGRVTRWRGLLAATLDQAPFEPVLRATVVGAPDSPSADLLAGWLASRLKCPVTVARSQQRTGIVSVRLERKSGNIDLVRPVDGNVGTLTQAGQPQRTISLAHRSDAECLADELRRLDPDEVYAAALVDGLSHVGSRRLSASAAVRAGEAPSPVQAERDVARIRRAARAAVAGGGRRKPDPSAPPPSAATIKKVTARRLPKGGTA